MVSVSCFGVRVSVIFIIVHYTLVQFGLLSDHLLGNSCLLPAWLAICSHCILSICYIYLFPVLVLRGGFAFRLLQLLFIAFLLLLVIAEP